MARDALQVVGRPENVIARRPEADEAIQFFGMFRWFSGSPRLLRSLAMTEGLKEKYRKHEQWQNPPGSGGFGPWPGMRYSV